jgi:hypothetical protein
MVGLEPLRGVVGDEPAVVDHDDALGELVGLVEIVGGEDDGGAVFGPQAADVLLQVGPVLRIQPGGRLVQEQQVGSVDQAHRNVQPAALSAGQRRHHPVGDALQVQ